MSRLKGAQIYVVDKKKEMTFAYQMVLDEAYLIVCYSGFCTPPPPATAQIVA